MAIKNSFVNLALSFLLSTILFTVGCSAQTEEQSLASLREMTKDGKLPPEAAVASIESRFSNTKTGALAKLLRARIKLENQDFAGAAAILNTDVFRKRTKLADHALWLRGKALQGAGNHAEALRVIDELLRDHPESVRTRDAKLLWATSAIAAGRAVEVPPFLIELTEKNDADALLLTAKAYEAQNSQAEAVKYFRRTYFYAAGSAAAKEAETKLTTLAQPLTPQNGDEQLARAEQLAAAKTFVEAANAYNTLASSFPATLTPQIQVRRITVLANAGGKMTEAQNVFNSLPVAAKEREAAYRELVLGYAKARMWPQARASVDAMRAAFPTGSLVPKTLIDAGLAARDAKNRTEEGYFLNLAHTAYPNAIEVAQAQFEAAWFQHDGKNFELSSEMFIEHLARYAAKDTSNRGKAGYWAARDSERAGKFQEACALYDGVIYRYSANWYGHLANERMAAMKSQRRCASTYAPNDTVAKAVANLKTVTVAAETAREAELARAEKSDELSTIGLFDWAIDELNLAKKTANNSPKINLALARHYRWKGDNVNALLALAKSYPDYAQMFPEEMGREEWAIFYPLTNWNEIKYWAAQRQLDPYKVAGLIRQESVFNPRARSSANAHGLMQLLVPTANSMAKKYVAKTSMVTPTLLYDPPLNIELGTAYMKDQLAKFGRIEYMAVAYNAGPGRVPQWRATLPAEMDEFVEAIPFKETRGYVQGIIRNTAQYRRLYDENGNFKPNVGTKPLRGEIDSKPREQFTAEFPNVVLDDNGRGE
ncbi:MAG: transglycosylase SLT domain-containing protein [Pyrinomonadaceae bacterium]